MSNTSMSHSDGGYECEFVDVPHDDDHCVICLLPARDPQQTKCECAKLYCKSCYDKLKTTFKLETCPTCRQPLDVFPDRKSARKVKGLRVKCTSTGCPWINELGSLNDHLQTCGYVLVPCSNGCKQHIVRDRHLLHCAEECPLRRHMCIHCKAEGPYKEMICGSHLDKCPDLMVPCFNSGCEVSIKRKDMASHHLECPHETISCPYKGVGCTYTSTRHTVADHKATSSGHHLDLAMVQLKKQGEEIRKMHYTTLVIKVSQFSELKVNNDRWCSPGFYTHMFGYKMCLKVHANGYGTHVSVFLDLMKGKNDRALTWPMKFKCIVTLLNQLKDEGHHSRTMSFTVDEEGGWGLHEFIAHTKLDLQEEEQCQYLKDDSLYFRVQVELIHAAKPWLKP